MDRQGSINHWVQHDGSFYKKNLWDKCYPSYSSKKSFSEAIGEYWDEYYSECAKLEKKYYDRFRIITLDELNKKDVLSEILDKNEIKGSLDFNRIKLNIGKTNDGCNMIPIPIQCL